MRAVNLLPKDDAQRSKRQQNIPAVVSTALIVLVTGLLGLMYFTSKSTATAKDLEYQDAQAELNDLQQELQNEFQRKLLPILEQIRKEKGLHVLFSAADSGVIAADPGLDLTLEAVKRLDSTAGAKPTAAAPPAAPPPAAAPAVAPVAPKPAAPGANPGQ